MRPLVLLCALLAGCAAEVGDDAVDESSGAETAACVPDAELRFTVKSGASGPPLVGFGAQYNQNLFTAATRAAGVTDTAPLAAKLDALAPAHVRIFFDSRALDDPELLASFEKTVALAQRAGATVNVTYWHGPYPDPAAQMQRFADVLADLVTTRGLVAVRAVTIQNEVNSTQVGFALYERLYRLLDADLRKAGLRDHLDLVGGDLLLDGQADWLAYMGAHMSDLLDGYSVHIYWDWNDPAKLVARLQGVRAIVNALPPAQRKPLYVTEFGVRGLMNDGEAAPGHLPDGTPIERSTTAALEQGWFDLLALKLGFVSTLRWDAYFAMYDSHPQYYSMIGTQGAGFPLKPSYHLLRMLTHVVDPGWRAAPVTGAGSGALVTAARGAGETTVLAMNNGGCRRRFHVDGLPGKTALYFITWNADGTGALAAHPRPTTSADGAVSVTLPPRTIAALTTRAPGLGL